MVNFEKNLKNYVELAVRGGVNVQKGQELVIACPVECAPMARLLVEEAYNAGAKEVFVRWGDSAVERLAYLNAEDSVFDNCPEWTSVMLNGLAKRGAAFLTVKSENPEALLGCDAGKIVRRNKSFRAAVAPYRGMTMNNESQWCIISVPSLAWSHKVFPSAKTDEEATELMWSAIFKACRVEDNPVAAWRKHSDNVKRNVKKLNDYNFKSLRFRNGLGTDLDVELPAGHVWAGALTECKTNGVWFSPNIPTEEAFTAPKKTGVNGVVFNAKPFVYNGNIIDGFRLELKDGRVVSHSAKRGEGLLGTLLDAQENVRFLGEVALVPYRSPISEMGILFYNMLYDENAACHLALGNAYPDTVKGGGQMSDAELEKAGLNKSPAHEDFMVGSADLSIVGTAFDGKAVTVFENGSYADSF